MDGGDCSPSGDKSARLPAYTIKKKRKRQAVLTRYLKHTSRYQLDYVELLEVGTYRKTLHSVATLKK